MAAHTHHRQCSDALAQYELLRQQLLLVLCTRHVEAAVGHADVHAVTHLRPYVVGQPPYIGSGSDVTRPVDAVVAAERVCRSVAVELVW